jgi:hypothetical protein
VDAIKDWGGWKCVKKEQEVGKGKGALLAGKATVGRQKKEE